MPFPNYQGGGVPAPSRSTGWGFPNWLQGFIHLFRPQARAAQGPTVMPYGWKPSMYRPAAAPAAATPAATYQGATGRMGGWAPGPRSFGSTFPGSQQVSPMAGWAPGPRTLASTFPATGRIGPAYGWAPRNTTPGQLPYGPGGYMMNTTPSYVTPRNVPVPPVPAGPRQSVPLTPDQLARINEMLAESRPLGMTGLYTPSPGYTNAPQPQGGGGYGWGGLGWGGGGRRSKYNAPPQYAGQPEQQTNNMQVRLPQQQGFRGVQQEYAPRWLQTLVNWQV